MSTPASEPTDPAERMAEIQANRESIRAGHLDQHGDAVLDSPAKQVALQRTSALPHDSEGRKNVPMARGLLDYFPAALAEIARVSQYGNEKHNPGEELHHARGKSTDHADCIIRHLVDRGTRDADGQRHSALVAWRALALLQQELEDEGLAPLPRGARL